MLLALVNPRFIPRFLYRYWQDMLEGYAAFLIVIPVVICMILASGVLALTINNDGRVFFDEDSVERQQLLSLEQRFVEQNSLLLVVSRKDGDMFSHQSRDAILSLTEKAWLLPYVTRVNSLSNYQHISSDGDELIIGDLITGGEPDRAGVAQRLRSYALAEPDLVEQIISRDGKTSAIVLNIAAPRGDGAAIAELMAGVDDLNRYMAETYAGIGLYVTGDVPLDHAFGEAYAADIATLFPAFLLVIFLVCYFFFRALRLAAIVLAMMILVVAATMGSAGYLGIALTAGTSGVPIILITIALADFIHILSTTRLGVRAGLDQRAAIFRSVRQNFLPITLTSFTTFIGFISLNFNDAPPFRDMGNLMAIGIGLSYVMTFTFFPALLLYMRLGGNFVAGVNRFSVSVPRIAGLSRLLVKHSRLIVISMMVLSGLICSGVARIELDDDWVKYFDKESDFRADTEFVVDNLTGVDAVEYIVHAPQASGIVDPGFLNRLDRFDEWALRQPEVVHVASIVPLFKKMNHHMNGAREGTYRIADRSDLNAQYLLMYEMSLPVGLDLNDRIDVGKEASRVTLTGQDMTSREIRDLDRRASEKLRELGLIAPDARGTGISLMFANLSEKNINSMLTGIAFAIGLVSLIIIIAFRSLSLGLLSFIVNILPIVLGFGVWGWLYQYAGLSLTVVAAIAFGIVVDDSIHFITKYKTLRDEGGQNTAQVLTKTFTDVGGALTLTTVILVLGFAVLAFSTFQPTWALGLISAIMVSFALLYDFLFLPALLVTLPPARPVK